MSDEIWNVERAQEHFLSAASRYFKEISKGAFLMGVSYQQLASTLQQAMIEEAYKRGMVLADDEDKDLANASTIFAISGIPRANIQRQLKESDSQSAPKKIKPQKEPVLSHVVRKWRTEFEDLPLARGTGRDPQTLMGLINAVRVEQDMEKEVRGKGVFDALKLSGMINRSKRDPEKWELSEGAFKGANKRQDEVKDGVSQDFYFLRENVGDHLAAAISNVLVSASSSENRDQRKMYERSVGSAISPKAHTIRSINDNFRKRAQSFFSDIGTMIEQAEPSFSAPPQNARPEDAQFRFGVYLWAPEILHDNNEPE